MVAFESGKLSAIQAIGKSGGKIRLFGAFTDGQHIIVFERDKHLSRQTVGMQNHRGGRAAANHVQKHADDEFRCRI